MTHLYTSVLLGVLVCLSSTVQADGNYWWMNEGAFGGNGNNNHQGNNGNGYGNGNDGNYQGNSGNGFGNNGNQFGNNGNGNNPGNQFQGNGFQQNQPGNNNQGGSSGGVLPVTQGLGNGNQRQNQGSCPVVNNIPPVDQCSGRPSNCWSVGQADVDCIDNALCCFDGCSNVCQGAGPRPGLPRPQTNARGQNTGSNNGASPNNNRGSNNNNNRRPGSNIGQG